MKNSIKVISLVGACLVSLLGTSCGNRKKDGPLVIWHDKEEGVIDVLSDAISSKLPDVEFEFIRKENLTETLKLVGNDPSSAPDMYIFAHDKIGLFDTIGILEPMENVIDLSLLDNYNDLTISSLSYNDRLLGVPLYYETLLFMYNKEKMTGRGRGKYMYKSDIRKDGEIFLREQMKKYFPDNKIEYIV